MKVAQDDVCDEWLRLNEEYLIVAIMYLVGPNKMVTMIDCDEEE